MIYLNNGDSHRRRTLGLCTEANHTSETQLNGWKKLTRLYFDIYNASPIGQMSPLDPRLFTQKVCGMLTDHAEDQKKLAKEFYLWKISEDHEVRGEQALDDAPVQDVLLLLAEEHNAAVERIGGNEAWAQLDSDATAAEYGAIKRAVIKRLGKEAFEHLPLSERRKVELFVPAGCCMHKDLNVFKGGYTALTQFWIENGFEGPCYLMNRDNDAAAALGNSAARTRALEKSVGGAIKLTELAGALFRHKNDKKGQQDSMRFFFASVLGRLLTFPDTSNTRFGSYGEAASVLIAHLPLFCEFLEQIRDKKENGQWNHMEENVYRGLHDLPTLTELVILSIYSEVVSRPYMREVRRPDNPNHLDLAPLHEQIIEHVQNIINNPDLVLKLDASPESMTFDGKPWERPEALDGARNLMPMLPHLRGALVAFFTGALATWRRFAAEYAPDGAIAQLSDEERRRAWRPATNDANEGELGSGRVTLRLAPHMTLQSYNDRTMYRNNETLEFERQLTSVDHKYSRTVARARDAAGLEKKRRLDLAEGEREDAAKKKAHRDAVQAQKDKRRDRLKAVLPILFLRELKMRNTLRAQIDEQLDWHREWVDSGPKEEKLIPMKKDLPSKEAMLKALRAAVKRYHASPTLQERAIENLKAVAGEFSEDIYRGWGVEEGEDVDDVDVRVDC